MHVKDSDLDRDLDRLVQELPAALREEWCVVPRRFLLQVFLVGLVLGAAVALVVLSYVYDLAGLSWAWPIVVVALMLMTRFVPWWRGDRFEEQLRASRSWRRTP